LAREQLDDGAGLGMGGLQRDGRTNDDRRVGEATTHNRFCP
jgi:hypothetical protein